MKSLVKSILQEKRIRNEVTHHRYGCPFLPLRYLLILIIIEVKRDKPWRRRYRIHLNLLRLRQDASLILLWSPVSLSYSRSLTPRRVGNRLWRVKNDGLEGWSPGWEGSRGWAWGRNSPYRSFTTRFLTILLSPYVLHPFGPSVLRIFT